MTTDPKDLVAAEAACIASLAEECMAQVAEEVTSERLPVLLQSANLSLHGLKLTDGLVVIAMMIQCQAFNLAYKTGLPIDVCRDVTAAAAVMLTASGALRCTAVQATSQKVN